MKLTPDKVAQLLPFFKSCFLKPNIEDCTVEQILLHAQLLQPCIHDYLYQQGDPIDDYYFLVQGLVGMQRRLIKHDKKQPDEYEDVDILQPGKVIGEYFNTLHAVREYAAEVKAECSQVVKVDKGYFEEVCSGLIEQYREVDQYARECLHLGKKVNSFQLFNLTAYRLGSSIKLEGELGVILEGECKIMYTSKHESASIHSCRNELPLIQPKLRVREPPHEIALIGRNQWVWTENLCESRPVKLRYVVASEKLKLLTIAVTNVSFMPAEKIALLRQLYEDRRKRIKNSEKVMSTIPVSLKSHHSSLQLQLKSTKSNRVLESLDPNLSPNLIRQKYKLGFNALKYESNLRLGRNSLIPFDQSKMQSPQRKPKASYHKPKDWSYYVKLPQIKQ